MEAAERLVRVKQSLAQLPSLQELLGAQLEHRAQGPDGLLNTLVYSLCGGSQQADWVDARIRGTVPGLAERALDLQRCSAPLGRNFDDQVAGFIAEVDAWDRLRDIPGAQVGFNPRSESKKAADLWAQWAQRYAFIEVKRDRGLNPSLEQAADVVRAWRLFDPALANSALQVWGSEDYHLGGLERDDSRLTQRKVVQTNLDRLLEPVRYEPLIAALRTGGPVDLGAGMLFAQVIPKHPAGVYMNPHWVPAAIDLSDPARRREQLGAAIGTPGTQRANLMSSLQGLGHLAYRVRDALPQLLVNAEVASSPPVLVAYVACDSYELVGIELAKFADAFAEVLQWDPRLSVIVREPGGELTCFGRDRAGRLTAHPTVGAWADYLDS